MILQLPLTLLLLLLTEDHLRARIAVRLVEVVWVGVSALAERLLGSRVCINGDIVLVPRIPLRIPELLMF